MSKFDFRDMLGGADANMSDDAMAREAANSLTQSFTALANAEIIRIANICDANNLSPVMFISFLMTRMVHASAAVSVNEKAQTILYYRELLNILEDIRA